MILGLNEIQNKSKADNLQYAKMLNGTAPIFSQFGDDIYASDVVQQVIYCIVTEMVKLRPKHIRRIGFDMAPVDDDIQRVLDAPNSLMTRVNFIEKVTYSVLLNYNAFIYKEYSGGQLVGLWPLSPTEVTFLETPNNNLYIKMLFRNGMSYTFPRDRIIHIKTHYSVNDFMGGDANGQPNNAALLSTVALNHALLEGVKKALNTSFAINGVVKYNTMLDGDKMEAAINDFEQKLRKSQSGFLGTDLKAEIIPFKRDLKLVDTNTLKFIDDKILRNYGVPLAVLQGDYTTEQYNGFYQRVLEPLIVNYSEAFTHGIFTEREIGFRNEIVFYPKELMFMSPEQTLEMVRILGDSGSLYENEKREAFGLPPLEELRGVRMQSLNYVDVANAAEYQVGQQKGDANNGEK